MLFIIQSISLFFIHNFRLQNFLKIINFWFLENFANIELMEDIRKKKMLYNDRILKIHIW